MTPKAEILPEIEALAVHCRPPLMEAEHRAMWLRDWCSDLAEFPIDAIRVACRKWRQSGSTKFPTAGQLLPLVRAGLPVERGPIIGIWRPASEEEYRAMTVREKIRELQIQAHEAHSKAGPMFRNTTGGGPMSRATGTHLAPGEMTAQHQHWVDEGNRLLAEVKRLREYLHRPEMIAAE